LKPSLIVHAGAGSGGYAKGDRRFAELKRTVEAGMEALRKGGALDGVEAAVRLMEGSGAFNCGRGACLTSEGKVELDAAVMWGDGRKGAGVGSVDCTYHPVSLARWVATNTRHVLMVGGATRKYARLAGVKVEDVRPSPASLERFRALTRSDRERNGELPHEEGGTVGAVAIDSDGMPAAAVSTGGTWLKLPGRVGDSAILGAGIYAERGVGAACATGTGEEIIRNSLCARAADFLRNSDAQSAARSAIEMMTRLSGRDTAGIITVDSKGRVGAALNTQAMGRAWYDGQSGRILVATRTPRR
jgi:L-asparaginase / beta-aspartyl-peptidase